jgi:hypothetical protein
LPDPEGPTSTTSAGSGTAVPGGRSSGSMATSVAEGHRHR